MGLNEITSYVAVGVHSPGIAHRYGDLAVKSNRAPHTWHSNCPYYAML